MRKSAGHFGAIALSGPVVRYIRRQRDLLENHGVSPGRDFTDRFRPYFGTDLLQSVRIVASGDLLIPALRSGRFKEARACHSAWKPAGRLTIKHEPADFQLPANLAVSKARQPAHSGGNHNRVVPPLIRGPQVRNAVTLRASFDQLPRDIAGDLKRFRNGPALRNKAGKFL